MFPNRKILLVLVIISIASIGHADEDYIAFSLREAQRLARSGAQRGPELGHLAGINRIIGMVFDHRGCDVILVGRKLPGYPEAQLDDLVTALRSRLCYDEWPLVSIDPTSDTPHTFRQTVTFRGGIQQTGFGRSFLESDVILKKYSLELLPSVPWVPSYASLCLRDIRDRVASQNAGVVDSRWLPVKESQELLGQNIAAEDTYQVRFWFFPLDPILFVFRDGVFCIKELQLGVSAELAFSQSSRAKVQFKPNSIYAPADSFAQKFTRHFWEMASIYPQLKSLKVLYDLVAVADGIRNLDRLIDLSYFVNEYTVSSVSTPRDHEFVTKYALIQRSDGRRHAIQIGGGIEFRTEIKWLNLGDVTPLREIVIQARPTENALWWGLPLKEWKMPNSRDLDLESLSRSSSQTKAQVSPRKGVGSFVQVQSYTLEPEGHIQKAAPEQFRGFNPLAAFPSSASALRPSVRYFDSLGKGGVEIDIPEKPISRKVDLRRLRDRILRQRPSKDSSSWESEKRKKE